MGLHNHIVVISCVIINETRCPIVVPVDCEFVVVVWGENVVRLGSYSNFISSIVCTRNLELGIQMAFSRKILLDEAEVFVGTINTSRVVDHQCIRIGVGVCIIYILEVIVENYSLRTICQS